MSRYLALNDPIHGRFARFFPVAAAVIDQPFRNLIVALPLALGLLAFSPHYSLSVLMIWVVLYAVHLERHLLNHMLLTPLTLFFVWTYFTVSVGVSIVVFDRRVEVDQELLTMQILLLTLFPLIVLAYRAGFGPRRPLLVPAGDPTFEAQVMRPLYWIAVFLFAYRFVNFSIRVFTGGLDRGYYSATSLTTDTFGLLSYFNIFRSFDPLAFFLLPFLYARATAPWRVVLIGAAGFILLFSLASGSRGLFIYPFVFLLLGAYFFRVMPRIRMEPFLLVVLFGLSIFIPLVDRFRNTQAYRETRLTDVVGKLAAFSEVAEARDRSSTSDREVLGMAIVGVSDEVIWTLVPAIHGHGGWENVQGILFTWVPSLLMPSKPVLYDANFIHFDLTGEAVELTGRAYSLQADLFRRFGWAGPFVGVPIFAFLYGYFLRQVFRFYYTKNALLGMLGIFFIVSFVQGFPYNTMLSTWWLWTYDVPKHLLALFGLYIVFVLLAGRVRPKGLYFYLPRQLWGAIGVRRGVRRASTLPPGALPQPG